jgi:hypothetical protein
MILASRLQGGEIPGMRVQADLVDQLFNSSEKRLARFLLLMAEFGKARIRQGHERSNENHYSILDA